MNFTLSTPAAPPPPAPPPKAVETVDILLVDDEARNLDVLESILQEPGYRLVRAGSANAALLALVQGDFAVLVLDIHMPDMNGLELANLVKQRKRTQHVPIIFLTAYYADEKYELQGYNLGAVDYLAKPVKPEILRMKVAVFVDLHRKNLALAESNRQLQLEVAQRQRSEELLREANAALETRVGQRTAELRGSEERLRETLTRMPAGVYTCDAAGDITFFNASAVEIWGREPAPGDKWTGALRVYRVDGTPLPRDEIPMAIALREGRALRGHEIVIERPDGTRRHVMPYPEILYDSSGTITGGINMLVDVTDEKIAIDALRRHEERTGQLMALMPAGVFACDTEGRLTFCNRRAIELWGQAPVLPAEPGQYCGCHRMFLPDGTLVHPETGPMATAVREGQSFRHLEMMMERPDGTRFHASLNIDVLRDPADQITGAIGVFQDVTERKEAELRTEFISRLSRELAALTEPGEIVRTACRILSAHLGAARCAFCSWEEGQTHAVISEDWHPAGAAPLTGLQARARLGPPEWWAEMKAGPAQVEDIEHDPRWSDYRAFHREIGVRSCATAGSLRSEASLVTLVIASPVPRKWSEHELALLDHVGARVWPAVERARAADALRTSEAKFRTLASYAPVGIFQSDATGRTTFVNPCWVELAGREAAEVQGQGWLQCIHPDDRERVLRHWETNRVSAGASDDEFRFLRPDGQVLWLQGNAVPLRNEEGTVTGYIGTVIDITERKAAEAALRSKEQQLRLVTDTAPIMLAQFDAGRRFTFVNRAYCEKRGLPAEAIIGHPIAEVVGAEAYERIAPMLDRVLAGETMSQEVEMDYQGVRSWISASCVPERDAAGAVCGWVTSLVDITERRRAHDASRLLAAIVKSSDDAIIGKQLDGTIMSWNLGAEKLFGYTAAEIVGQSITVLIPETRRDEEPAILARVRRGESIEHYETVRRCKNGALREVSLSISPIRDEAGRVIGASKIARDITAQKQAEQELRRRESLYRGIGESIDYGIWICDAQGRNTYASESFLQLVGLTQAQCALEGWTSVLHPGEAAATQAAWEETVRTGAFWEREHTFKGVDGKWHPILARGVPIRNDQGAIISWVGINLDITAFRTAQRDLQKRTRMLESVNRLSDFLVAERDVEKIVQRVTDVGREVTGAAFGAFFYNVTDERGESLQLFTISGAPREAFEKFGMPRNTPIFAPTFEGQGVMRSDDIRKDPRYGRMAPHHGMPKGHLPVRSYLAVPVTSRTGAVIGGLFFGHPEPGVFQEESEKILTAMAAQAAIAIDNAKLYRELERELGRTRRAEAELQAAQTELKQHADELEEKVQERTVSLTEAILQMEEFSYTVSHDLRAPLRAMNTYAEALIDDYGPALDPTAKDYLVRIQRSSQRMEKLTHDMLMYSRLARSEVVLGEVNLDLLVRDLVNQYEEFQPPRTVVEVAHPLAPVIAHEVSLGQSIANLMTNAVKFVAPGVQPRIRVRTEDRDGRVRLWIEDNGIGIKPEYHTRIFQVFERLHGREQYEGTGMGLAIVRKVMEKTGGACGLESTGQGGSRFWLEFPKP